MHEAAQLAHADEFIRRLPEGYDTVLGERGSGLSQGQRQLIAIARAALANPRILILDEATSSVDTRTERQIQKALDLLLQGRTSFVIAHRLSTIRNADQVLVLSDGGSSSAASTTNCWAARGAYYELYMSQFRAEELGRARRQRTQSRRGEGDSDQLGKHTRPGNIGPPPTGGGPCVFPGGAPTGIRTPV